MRGHDRGAEITLQQLSEVFEVLNVDGLVEPELQKHLVVDFLRGAIADDGEHRIGRHHPADGESNRGQPDEGQDQAGKTPLTLTSFGGRARTLTAAAAHDLLQPGTTTA